MIRLHESMSRSKKLREKPPEREEFNVMLVKCCEPIMIKDELKTEDEKKVQNKLKVSSYIYIEFQLVKNVTHIGI